MGAAGGEVVAATVQGVRTVKSLQIKDEILKAGDTEMLKDLVVAAVNEALRTAKATHDTEIEKISGGMSLPGLF